MALNLSFLDDPVSKSEALQEENYEEIENLASNHITNFTLPIVSKTKDFLQGAFDNSVPGANPIKLLHGTTTLSFVYKGGIVVAVDSRATQGPYIASQSVQKVIEINPFMLGTMAGGAADCQYWERELGRRTRLFQLKNKERMSIAAASKILANIMYYYRDYGLSLGCMVCGWDKRGPNIYYVDNDGTRLKGQRFSVGSGSTFAYGVLDSEYDYNMETNAALELGQRAIWGATHRDAYSGGVINLYHIDQNGWKKISSIDNNDLYWTRYGKHVKDGAVKVVDNNTNNNNTNNNNNANRQ